MRGVIRGKGVCIRFVGIATTTTTTSVRDRNELRTIASKQPPCDSNKQIIDDSLSTASSTPARVPWSQTCCRELRFLRSSPSWGPSSHRSCRKDPP